MTASRSAMVRLRARLRSTPLHTVWRYGQSTIASRRDRDILANVRSVCLFLGHARSGHSIVGALLDAHPQIIISDELDALRYIDAGFTADQVLSLAMIVSERQARRARRKAGQDGATYSYAVPDQWQGVHRDLRVVGDSQAGWSVQRLARDPSLLDRTLDRVAPRRLQFIHVTRNPFDNIATLMLRGRRTFESAFDRYFANCESIVALSARLSPDDLLRLRHEDVVLSPADSLARACGFLGLEADDGYLDACASILYPNPSRSRAKISWTDGRHDRVNARIAEFEFLEGYAFDS